MSATGHPIVVRRAEPGDAEAIHSTFTGPRVIAGTLQVPYPSVEMWRKRLAEFPSTDYLLVATVASGFALFCPAMSGAEPWIGS